MNKKNKLRSHLNAEIATPCASYMILFPKQNKRVSILFCMVFPYFYFILLEFFGADVLLRDEMKVEEILHT